MVTSRQFINALAKNAGMTTNEASYILEHFVNVIIDTVQAEDSVTIQGFGVFEKKKKAEKRLFNPTTGQRRVIPASTTLAFKQSPKLKTNLNPDTANTAATKKNNSEE
ncbi:MAG: HU family DNA-binding protein [Bacteroidaceae bacterium]|nr:HU family DNA-binding protein [Bacteroidaceae bacterium]MBQ8676210.1 HU family DNA-binding protein [Bacteroidaceae bacterium]